jgi:hypothetical protein
MKRKFGDTHGGISRRDLEALDLLKNHPAFRAKAEAAKKRFCEAYMAWLRARISVIDAEIALVGVLEGAASSPPVWLALDELVGDMRTEGHSMAEFDALMKRFPGPK